MPRQSLDGSYASSLCRRYCCSHRQPWRQNICLFSNLRNIHTQNATWGKKYVYRGSVLRLYSSHSRASFPVDVLLERVEVEQREHFAPGVVRPEWRDHFFLDRTSVAAEKKSKKTNRVRLYYLIETCTWVGEDGRRLVIGAMIVSVEDA